MNRRTHILVLGGLLAAANAHAQDADDAVELEAYIAEEEIGDTLGILPTEPVSSVFGFGKTILDTPRAVSSVDAAFLREFNITSINDIATFVPGTFTTSFFGVAGSLDIRGTAAENYFRGIKRLNNDGNFPTPIAASNRIDVIRGPMSPISGPSRVGGALNFVPKSARAETGAYLDTIHGEINATGGSWNKKVIQAELGGPIPFLERPAGFYTYIELEDSDSYFVNDSTEQQIVQTSFNIDLTDRTRIEFGGQYQYWNGFENAGWNRVTQDLIDNGTYISGDPVVNLDTDGSGQISQAEIEAFAAVDADMDGNVDLGRFDPAVGGGCFGSGVGPGGGPPFGGGNLPLFCTVQPNQITPAMIDPRLAITNDGTVQLSRERVLIDDSDKYETTSLVNYFDLIHEFDNGITMTNKVFFEYLRSQNQDAYGFSKESEAWVVENQLIFAGKFSYNVLDVDWQLSPSIRYTDAEYQNDFADEVFDRVDLSKGFSPTSIQEAAVRGLGRYTVDDSSEYVQYGFSGLFDITAWDRAHLLAGARYEIVDISADTGNNVYFFFRTPGAEAEDTDGEVSFTLSGSYDLPYGFKPYVTYSEQATVISGTSGEVTVANVAGGTFIGVSDMIEAGMKASLLNDRLFAAIAIYRQNRIFFNSNAPISNEATRAEGIEMEARYVPGWVPDDRLSLVATATLQDIKRTDLDADGDGIGTKFSYFGISQVPQLDPRLFLGGALSGNIAIQGDQADRGGIPQEVYSFAGTYRWNDNFNTSLSVTYVNEVSPSFVPTLELPDYVMMNIGLNYNTDKWRASVYLENILDETYFRGNFPGLYGNNAILPGTPFGFQAVIGYKF